MEKKNDTLCCSFDKGEIFPGMVLNEKYSAKDQSSKLLKAKRIRACHQEMLDNFKGTH